MMHYRRIIWLFTLTAACCSVTSHAAEQPVIEIRITGIEGEQAENARQFLTLNRYRDRSDLSELILRHYYRQGMEEIAQSQQPFGYYDARVTGSIKKTEPKAKTRWLVSYDVKLKEPVRWRELAIAMQGAGKDDEKLVSLLAKPGMEYKEQVYHPDYSAFKSRLLESANLRGYFDAAWVEHKLQVYPSLNAADVTLLFDTGQRYRYGQIELSETQLDPDFLRKFRRFETGEGFAASDLLDLQYALSDSDYFNRVEVAPQLPERPISGEESTQEKTAEELEVPIVITLEAAKRDRYSIGAGYGTDTGIRGSLGFLRRWVNRHGHSFAFDVQASEIADRAVARYIVPRGLPPIDDYTYSISTERREVPDGSTRLSQVAVARTETGKRWKFSQYLKFERERFTANNSDNDAITTLFYPGFTASRTVSDDLLYPTRGYSVNFDIHGALDAVLSDINFLQSSIELKAIYGLLPKTRLLFRNETAYTLVDDFAQLPVSQRFYTGGDNSVRGYGFQDLSPRDENGDPVGGRHKQVLSAEIEQRLSESWAVAAFFDAGNAFDSWPGDLKYGTGLGLRWRLPVGSLKIDLAHPLNDDDTAITLHLGLGPDL